MFSRHGCSSPFCPPITHPTLPLEQTQGSPYLLQCEDMSPKSSRAQSSGPEMPRAILEPGSRASVPGLYLPSSRGFLSNWVPWKAASHLTSGLQTFLPGSSGFALLSDSLDSEDAPGLWAPPHFALFGNSSLGLRLGCWLQTGNSWLLMLPLVRPSGS